MNRTAHRAFGFVALAAVLTAVVWGFVIVGSPETRRIVKFDERRLQDLRNIVYEMQNLVHDTQEGRLKRALFDDLESLRENARHRKLNLEDPESGEPYGFRVVSPSTYELCATFSMARNSTRTVFWNHPAGRHCWTIDALDPP